ncbi:MAG: hypothetical protein PVH17_02980 [Anaerolineae bacterium]|jgi:hypothetical protein
MSGWRAFRTGLGRTLRYPQVWLLLFAANLFSALLLAILPALGLAAGLGHRPAIYDAADGVDAWYVIETLMTPLSSGALTGAETMPEPGGLGQDFRLTLLLILSLPLVAWVPSAFLSGGLLLTYVETPQHFRWRRFLWGCWHWWGAFLLLGVVQGVVSVVALGPILAVAVGIVAAAGRWLAWIIIPSLAIVTALGLALMECTRAFAVIDGTRNVLHAFGKAIRLVFRRPLPVGGLYGLSFLMAGLLHVLFRLGLMPVVPLEWWPLVLFIQQAFILLRLGTRFARLAGGVALIQQT